MLAIVLLITPIIAVALLMSATGIMVYALNSSMQPVITTRTIVTFPTPIPSPRKPGAESRDQFGNERCSPHISPDAVRAYIAIQQTQAIQVTQMIQASLKTHQEHWSEWNKKGCRCTAPYHAQGSQTSVIVRTEVKL